MARIAGIDLPRDKRIEIGLTYIYGIGRKTASDILFLNVDPLPVILCGGEFRGNIEFQLIF